MGKTDGNEIGREKESDVRDAGDDSFVEAGKKIRSKIYPHALMYLHGGLYFLFLFFPSYKIACSSDN